MSLLLGRNDSVKSETQAPLIKFIFFIKVKNVMK